MVRPFTFMPVTKEPPWVICADIAAPAGMHSSVSACRSGSMSRRIQIWLGRVRASGATAM